MADATPPFQQALFSGNLSKIQLVHTLTNLKPKLSRLTNDILPECLLSPGSEERVMWNRHCLKNQQMTPSSAMGLHSCGALEYSFHHTIRCTYLLENSC